MQKQPTNTQPNPNRFFYFLQRLRKKISSLFQLEEVEVTFKVDGKNTSYTYTKVEKHAA